MNDLNNHLLIWTTLMVSGTGKHKLLEIYWTRQTGFLLYYIDGTAGNDYDDTPFQTVHKTVISNNFVMRPIVHNDQRSDEDSTHTEDVVHG